METLSYTEASHELDAIVSFFEQREVDVDVSVTRLERATALIDELDRRLRRTRAQVEELVPRLETLAAETAGSDSRGCLRRRRRWMTASTSASCSRAATSRRAT